MPSPKTKLLLVDDDDDLRESFSAILTELGFSVRSAKDGFSALGAIRQQMPDILLSDLNMPGMSGFELLSVIRRRFPRVQVIAMSGALPEDGREHGIVADVIYAKGSNLTSLFSSLRDMADPDGPRPPRAPSRLAPIWICHNEYEPLGRQYIIITCPECLRTFPQAVGEVSSLIHETHCVFCRYTIYYAVLLGTEMEAPQWFQH